jgi:predicted Zn-dependent protease
MRRLAILLVLAGCAAPPPAPETKPVPPPPPETRKETVAVASLMDSARSDVAAGRLSNAAATLERAIRIEPANPRLWQQLAQVRLQQGQYAQAESTAMRSNSYAGSDSALRAENERIIEASRARKPR